MKHKKANLRHLLCSKSRGRKRKLRKAGILNPGDASTMRALLPYA